MGRLEVREDGGREGVGGEAAAGVGAGGGGGCRHRVDFVGRWGGGLEVWLCGAGCEKGGLVGGREKEGGGCGGGAVRGGAWMLYVFCLYGIRDTSFWLRVKTKGPAKMVGVDLTVGISVDIRIAGLLWGLCCLPTGQRRWSYRPCLWIGYTLLLLDLRTFPTTAINESLSVSV